MALGIMIVLLGAATGDSTPPASHGRTCIHVREPEPVQRLGSPGEHGTRRRQHLEHLV